LGSGFPYRRPCAYGVNSLPFVGSRLPIAPGQNSSKIPAPPPP
jgi:hypothetical protein